jgi:hypothetical protein
MRSITDNTLPVCDLCEHAKTTCMAIQKEREAPRARLLVRKSTRTSWAPPLPIAWGAKNSTSHSHWQTATYVLTSPTKNETLAAYKAFAAWANAQHGVSIKRFCSDRGGESTGRDFDLFLREQGTERPLTTHDTPQHNRIAESLNRQLVERVRAVLHCSDLPKTLWQRPSSSQLGLRIVRLPVSSRHTNSFTVKNLTLQGCPSGGNGTRCPAPSSTHAL